MYLRKSPENVFFGPKNCQKKAKIWPFAIKTVKIALFEGQNLTEKFDSTSYLSTFIAENTIKSGPFKAKYDI